MNIKVELCENHACTGCTACKAICPVDAIEMKYNEQGFLYPNVDETKCVHCGACNLIVKKLNAPANTDSLKKVPKHYYAVRLCDKNERMQSQSGGLFYALALAVVQNNGLVCGCAFQENFHVGHIIASNVEELQKLRGSKYVQSDLMDCFRQIKDCLNAGKEVLFSGTPCQCAGINTYLEQKGVPRDKFYSCDLICHGTPSPIVFEKFIELMEEKYNSKIKYLNLRDKAIASWHEPVERIIFANDKVYQGKLYGEIFYSNLAQRKSCHNCKYTILIRPSDITIGDCWGIEKTLPESWNDETGISVALIQNSKGERLFERARQYLDLIVLDTYTQANLEHPSPVPKQMDNFWRDYQKLNFEDCLKKYTSIGGIRLKIKRKLLRMIGKW